MRNFPEFCISIMCLTIIIKPMLGVVQEITIYSDYNQTGTSLTFSTKEADLTPHREFLDSAKSFCSTAPWWDFFRGFNYSGALISYSSGCRNFSDFSSVRSMRFMGPSNTSTEAISLYNGAYLEEWGGEERIVEDREGNEFGFFPKYIVLTGGSSWTLFNNNNYTGNSSCVRTEEGYEDYMDLYTTNIAFSSVRKGCLCTNCTTWFEEYKTADFERTRRRLHNIANL